MVVPPPIRAMGLLPAICRRFIRVSARKWPGSQAVGSAVKSRYKKVALPLLIRSMISLSVICATRPRACNSSYKVIETSSCFVGQRKQKRPLQTSIWQRARKSRYHLCLPPPHRNGLTSAPHRDGIHSCVCNARTRHSLLAKAFSLQLREVFPLLFCDPLHQPGLLWTEHFRVLVPFIAINKDYFITMLRACQPPYLQRLILAYFAPRPSISRALARESSVMWSPEISRASASTLPSSSSGWISV